MKPKTKEDAKREALEREIASLSLELKEAEKKVLSRVFIRDADLFKMQTAKEKCEELARKLRLAKNKLNRMEQYLK